MDKTKAITNTLITVFFGFLGVHKFMQRKIGVGFLYLFTMGLFGIGWMYDSVVSIIKCVKLFSLQKSCISSSSFNHIQVNETQIQEYNFNQPFDNMDGHTFEHYCADILSKNGFYNVEVTRGSGDQGIDIIAHKDGVKYGIQCKCYSSDIGNKAVQEAFSGKTFYGCHVAAVLTNRYFTKSAKELSENNKVLLWDRDKLEEYVRNADNNQKQY